MNQNNDSMEPMIRNKIGWLLFALLLLATPFWMWDSPTPATPPPIFSTPESVALINQDGETVELSDLSGDIVIVSFLFTRCPDVCPALAARFVDLESRVPETIDGIPIRFVSLTVDPEYDQPEVLTAYRSRFDSDSDRWQLWTGDPDRIASTVADFQQALERISEDGDAPVIAHSERFILLDPRGRIRNFYPSDEVGMQGLERDLYVVASGS